MHRVSVVGCSGAGKTTVGRRLAGRLDVPFVELDSLYHQAGWVPLPTEEFRSRVERLCAADGWVVDGNYSLVRDLVLARADTVVWIDPPRWRVMAQVVPRSLARVISRRPMWNGNRESWRNLISRDPEESIIRWAWTTYQPTRQRYTELSRRAPSLRLGVVRLRTRRDVVAFLRSTAH